MLNQAIPELKIILLGESGVGKTCIIKRYLENKFNENEISSPTMSYVGKIVEINNKKIKLNIWDTIGQEKFRSISKMFLKETHIVILVYDITAKESFNQLDYWYNLYKENLGPNTILGVAANKSDLYEVQEVSDQAGTEYAKNHEATFSLISAKENKESIDHFMNKLVKAYIEKNNVKNDNDKAGKVIKLNKDINKTNDKGRDGCCSGGKKKIRQKKYESILKTNKGFINSIFLGDNGVGKTSLIKRLSGKEFNKDEEHTSEITETLIYYKNDSIKIKLKIYDIDNEKKKSKETIEKIRNSNIFFLVYDVKDKKSLENVGFWIEAIKKCKEEDKKKDSDLLYIIGNKRDKNKKSELNENGEENKINMEEYIDEGKQIANKNKAIFRATSALDNDETENIIGEAIESYLNIP